MVLVRRIGGSWGRGDQVDPQRQCLTPGKPKRRSRSQQYSPVDAKRRDVALTLCQAVAIESWDVLTCAPSFWGTTANVVHRLANHGSEHSFADDREKGNTTAVFYT